MTNVASSTSTTTTASTMMVVASMRGRAYVRPRSNVAVKRAVVSYAPEAKTRAASRAGSVRVLEAAVSLRQTHHLLPPARQRRGARAHRRGIPGVQRRAPLRSLPHLHRQDARARERHDHRAHGRRRAHPRRSRRLHRRADGTRPRRLPDQHGREPVSRPALRAELHAAPRLAVRERRRPVRRGHHPHLRRAVPGDGAARDRQLRPRLPRAPRARRADCDLGAALPARPRPAGAPARVRGVLRASRPPRGTACRSTPRRPATARSG